jgi:hypothetical protein
MKEKIEDIFTKIITVITMILVFVLVPALILYGIYNLIKWIIITPILTVLVVLGKALLIVVLGSILVIPIIFIFNTVSW